MKTLLLHGVSGGQASFAPLLARLAADGVVGEAWSAPGYDGRPVVEPYNLPHLATLLEEEAASAPAILVGHSMGGMIALTCAAQWHRPPAGLVLLCTVPAFQLRGPAREDFLARRLAGIDVPGGMRTAAGRLIPDLVASSATQETREMALAVMAGIPPRTYHQAVAALTDYDLRPHLARMEMPVLCLSGAEDRVSPPEVMAALARALPDAIHHTHAAAGHLLPQEQPAWVAARIGEFLATRFPA